MNVYLIISKSTDILQEMIDYWPRYESGVFVDLVVAETPGKAKSTFLRHHDHSGYLEYTDVASCRIVEKGTDRDPGILPSNDKLWDMLEPLGYAIDAHTL